MPFGLDLDDITDAASAVGGKLNPFDNDAPKRPKKKPKKKKKQQKEQDSGFWGIVHAARKEPRAISGAIGQIVEDTGVAGYRDIRNALPGKDPFPYTMVRSPKTGKMVIARDKKGRPIPTGGHLAESLFGTADVMATETARQAKDIALVGLGDDWTVAALSKFDKAKAEALRRKEKQAEKRLAQAPISTVASVFGGAGIASKALTVPMMADRMMKATPGLTRQAAVKAAQLEHKNPGIAKSMGVEGGFEPRTITTAEGKTAVGRPWSRTPGGRTGQRIYDSITTQIDRASPNAPFSASRRVGSIERRRQGQELRGALASLTPHIEALGDVLEGTESRRNVKGKVRQAIGIHRPIRERAEALIAALEGPQDATIRQSVEARIASLEDTLDKSAALHPLRDQVRVLRKRFENEPDLDARREIAQQLGDVTAQLDLALGRKVERVSGSPHRRRALREWERRFGKRKANALVVVSDALARSRNPTDPKAWYEQHLAEVTSEEAQAFADRVDPIAAQYQTVHGRRFGLTRPRYNPLSVDEAISRLREQGGVIGIKKHGRNALFTVRGKGAGAVFYGHGSFNDLLTTAEQQAIAKGLELGERPKGGVDNIGEDTLRAYLDGAEVVYHGDKSPTGLSDILDALAFPDEVPVFYSELQRQVDNIFTGKTQRMVNQSLRKKIKERVSDVEWDALGMDAFFDQFPPTYRITEEQLQHYLAIPMNAYNLDEVIYSSLAPRRAGGVEYADEYANTLVYKTPTPQEPYYELIMSLGESPRRWLEEPAEAVDPFYSDHWSVRNPIVHVRFHMVTDNSGKKAIVIDEIQSDWHSEVRKRQGRITPSVRDAAESVDPAQLAATMEELRAQKQAIYDADPRLKQLDEMATQELDYTRAVSRAQQEVEDWPGGDPEEIEALEKVLRDAEKAEEDFMDAHDALEDAIGEETLSKIDQIESDMGQLLYRQSQATNVAKVTHFEDEWKLGDTEIDAAVRRMMRWAHDSDVDRIIIVPADIQMFRNLALPESPSGRILPDIEIDGALYHEFVEGWKEFEGMDADAMRAFARRHADSEEARAFVQMYEKRYPAEFEKAIGHKGRFIDGIITGRYTDALNTFTSDEIPLRGWVIDLGEEGRRRAAIPMRQMQQMPEWDALPRGATELLADGRTAMRLFEGANVDTVIHELAHIALPDLDAETRATIEGHFGGSIDDWSSQQHEAFARAFEQYMRSGRAANVHLASAFSQIAKWMRQVWRELYHGREEEAPLHPEVAAGFDRLLGYQGVPTVLSKVERSQVRSQIKSLTKALDEPLESDAYQHALATLELISAQIEAAGEEILTHNQPEPVAQAIREGLTRRRDLVTNRMAEQGVLPGEWTPETRARGYFPQTSIWDIQGMPQAQPVRMAAVQDVVGTPRLENKTIMRKPNRLIRYSTGEVLNDPSVLVRVLRSRMRFIATLNARNELWDMGKPIKAGEKIPRGVALIRNPNKTPKKIADDIYAALRLPPERFAELEMRGKMDEIDEAEDLKDAAKDFIWMPGMEGPKPHWVSDAENVRAVPLGAARTRLGDVFSSAPRGTLAAVAGGANAMARLSAIYLPFAGGRYVARNAAQNAVMLALTQPTALARIGKAHSAFKNAEPELYSEILAEGGTILGTALPEFNTRPKGLAQEMERYVTERSGATGSFLGQWADNPFRWASWTKHAERYGYHGPEGYARLLHDPDLKNVKETVMQRTREDMIDFDALTPFEKEVVSRYMFLWPFIRGITKWPFMYFREYPLRVAAAGALARGAPKEEGDKDTGAVRESLMLGGRNFSWLDPTGPAQENFERVERIVAGKDEVKLSAVADMLAPHWREIIQSLSDRQGKTWKQALANTYVPFASTVNALNRGGSPIDQLDRFLGQSQEPPMSIVNQRKERADEINGYLDKIEERGFEMPEDKLGELMTAHNAYEKYKELSAQSAFGLRDQGKDPSLGKDSKNHRLRAAILIAVAEEYYPGNLDFTLEDYDDLTAEGRKVFFREVEEGLWGARTDFLRQAKEEFGKKAAA